MLARLLTLLESPAHFRLALLTLLLALGLGALAIFYQFSQNGRYQRLPNGAPLVFDTSNGGIRPMKVNR